MKKVLFCTLLLCITMTLTFAQNIELPAPQTGGGAPLMDVLSKRSTHREFSTKELTDQQLSNLLWAANGVNRSDGKRTAPSARNCQEIDIYAFTKKGVYLYIPEKNVLEFVQKEDLRKEIVLQPFAAEAPVVLIFVAKYDKMKGMDKDAQEFYGATDAGFVSQNVYLYCASEGLNTVVLGSIQRDYLKKLLQFNGKAILGQPVGFAK